MTINLLLQILAFICFILGIFSVKPFGLETLFLGLAFWVLSRVASPVRFTINLLFLILAFVCFVLGMFTVNPFGLSALYLGLSFWVLAEIIPPTPRQA